MVQVLKEEIKEAIYLAAVKEFYEKDYKTATMRNIANKANVPTSLIYTYYKNKKSLFAAIVQPIFLKIKNMLEQTADKGENHIEYMMNEELDRIFYLMRDNRRQLLILVDKSKGTEYEGAKEKLISFLQVHIKQELGNRLKDEFKTVNDVFFHIIANNFLEGLLEIIRHYKDDKWAEEMTNLIFKYHIYGINSFVQ